MGSLEHAETELFNVSTLDWKSSSPFFNYKEIYSFATFFYNEITYVLVMKLWLFPNRVNLLFDVELIKVVNRMNKNSAQVQCNHTKLI